MGGYGSGMGFRPNRKRSNQFVEMFPAIDTVIFPYKGMQCLPKEGKTFRFMGSILTVFKDKLRVRYKELLGEESWHYDINFVFTQPTYGNKRYWFECPKCKRMCRKLHLINSSEGVAAFICRLCIHLVYRSQNRTECDQIIHKKWALIEELGVKSEFILDEDKPKWMHWKRFDKMRDEIEYLHDKAFKFAPLKEECMTAGTNVQ